MLTISPLHTRLDEREQDEMGINCSNTTLSPFSVLGDHLDFPEFSPPVGCLLDSIDFDDLINDGDVLPDLEMDPVDFMAEFSVCPSFAGDLDEVSGGSADMGNQVVPDCYIDEHKVLAIEASHDDEFESPKSRLKEKVKSKKISSSQSQAKKNNNNNNQGKKKTKVDWTPDLHRRFVQAVEQLGVDKAVPSRILELMGIDCLTRHNVASHLQKYRSHRKHLLAREAEAASWTQKRQMYGIAVAPASGVGGGGGKNKVNHPWHPPTIGFPPMTPPPPPIHHHNHFRPLHVWGHPTHHVEHQPMIPMWSKPLVRSPSPPLHPPTWAVPPPIDPSFWHSHHQHSPTTMTPTTSCFPQTIPNTRLAAATPVPGIPQPHTTMYKPPSTSQSAHNHPRLDLHPTKESIDAVIGDVLSKPWLPLPIGLKPPSTDSVMVELQRQGIPKIPPS